MSQNLTPTHIFKLDSVNADSPVDAAAGSLENVAPKIPDVRAALKTMALTLLAYMVIRLDVAAKAGAGHREANRLMHKVHGTKRY